MITYDSTVAYTFPGQNNPSLQPEQGAAVHAMEREGATVILEDTGREYVVKVRVPGARQIRKSSTSGYPVGAAYEAWQQLPKKDGEK